MKNRTSTKSYRELKNLNTFEERYDYLREHGEVGFDTFGFDRHMNQKFYKSKEWENVRQHVILRDEACDLGIKGKEINSTIYIHHINPIGPEDIKSRSSKLLDPDNLITTSFDTHNAIHFGSKEILNKNQVITRTANDHCPWKK